MVTGLVGSDVLHVIDNMRLGGAQRIVSRLVENNSSHSLHVLRQSEEQMKDTEDYTITESNWKFNIRSFLDVWRLVNRERPEIVHCHLKKSYFVGLMVKMTSLKDFRLVFHEHGEIWKGNQRYNTILRYAGRLINRHVAVSEHTAELLMDRGSVPQGKIEVIYNFVDREKFNPEILESFQGELDTERDSDRFTVGYAGRLVERKGWKTMVSAAERLDEDFQILMTGSGKSEEELAEKAEEIDNLEYLGYLEDVRTLFAAIDCFVLPSHWDPSPMVLYEIHASGIPLISTDAHSIDELVENKENSILFEAGNAGQLSSKIRELEEDSGRQDELKQGGLKSAERYSYSNYIESLETLYSELDRS